MDAASLLLGISSLFPICVQGYKLIASAKSFPTESSILFWKLKTQELRFIIWGQAYGFEVRDLENIDKPLHRTLANANDSKAILDLTHGILSSIKDVVCSIDKLTTRYGLEEIQPNVSSFAPARAMSRVRWAVRDKKAFENLISDLTYFNDGLYCTLTPQRCSTAEFAIAATLPAETEDITELKILQDIAGGSKDLSATANFKAYNIQVHQANLAPGPKPVELELSITSLNFSHELSSSERRSLAILTKNVSGESQSVFVEWKTSDQSSASVFGHEHSILRVRRLAQLLAQSPKPPDFRTLLCIGYVCDRFLDRVGLVFQLPAPHISYMSSWITQGGVIDQDRDGQIWTTLQEFIVLRPKLPLLGHRFSLALALAKSMIQWHATGWFHKAFSSNSVLFFRTPDGPQSNSATKKPIASASAVDWDLRDPNIIGFDFSRPAQAGEFSDNKFYERQCHPAFVHSQYLHSISPQATTSNDSQIRFKSEFDMFSLGCVLLEIGLWRSLITLWKEEYLEKDTWVQRLCQKYVPELAGRCGQTYQSIVLDLLTRADPRGRASNAQHSLTNFELVQMLEQLHV